MEHYGNYKMKFEFDYDKLQEENYDMEKLEEYTDWLYGWMEKEGIYKDEEGFYVGGSYESFWAIILKICDDETLLHYLKEWHWYNFEEHPGHPEECEGEELLEHYRKRLRLKRKIG